MATFEELKKRISLIRNSLSDWYEEEIIKLENDINKNITDQLSSGKRGDGQSIQPFYSRDYADKKGFRVPDLKVSGDFHKSIGISSVIENIVLIDGYKEVGGYDVAGLLEKRYGSEIYELNKANEEKILNEVNLKIKKRVNDAISN